MDEITQEQKDAFASMFFGGLVDRTLYENGMPTWLRAADSKILAIRANLDEPPVLFGLSGWLTNKVAVECWKCAVTIEPNSTLYVGHEWKPRCEACEAAAEEEHKRWLTECETNKREAMLRRAAAAKERWRQANQPDPRQCGLFEVKP